jgi:hypothetical protein
MRCAMRRLGGGGFGTVCEGQSFGFSRTAKARMQTEGLSHSIQ